MHLASHDTSVPDTLPQPVRDYVTRLVRRHAYAVVSAAGVGWAAWFQPGVAVPCVLALVTYVTLTR